MARRLIKEEGLLCGGSWSYDGCSIESGIKAKKWSKLFGYSR